MATTASAPELAIDVGTLVSTASLVSRIGRPLERFTEYFQEGGSPTVTWNMTELRRGSVSISALCGLLAVACRLRQYTSVAPDLRLPNDEVLLRFLAEVSFFEVGRRYDLWRAPPDAKRAMFRPGRPHPHAGIFDFYLEHVPDKVPEDKFHLWKEWVRRQVKSDLALRCGSLFRGPAIDRAKFRGAIADELAIACAEFALNAVIHGRAPAFIGLQRSSARISVAVSDCGVGLLQTLQAHSLEEHRKHARNELPYVTSDLEAILLASLVNRQAYGIRRAIGMVIASSGWINLASGNSEVVWRAALWDAATHGQGTSLEIVNNPNLLFGKDVGVDVDDRHRPLGYGRRFPYGLRGTRVAFELPVEL